MLIDNIYINKKNRMKTLHSFATTFHFSLSPLYDK